MKKEKKEIDLLEIWRIALKRKYILFNPDTNLSSFRHYFD